MSQPVAIVGLSLRYPGFCGPSAFFNSCRQPFSRLRKAPLSAIQAYQQNHPDSAHPYRINNDLYGSIRIFPGLMRDDFVSLQVILRDPSPFLCLQVASEALLDHQADAPLITFQESEQV